jgi:hypothetical protein
MLGIMAENMPRTTPEFISWSRTHAEQWGIDPAAIGLTPAQAAQFAALADELAAANLAAAEAREASITATRRLHEALAAARVAGGQCVGSIKAYARVTGNPEVYNEGWVSPAAPQGTLPPPNPPETFSSRVNGDGSLTVKWTARQPVGVTDVVYMVYRRVGGEREFTLVGAEGKNKSFTDRRLPVGVSRVEYMVRPKRGDEWGAMSAVYSVQFGTVSGTRGSDAIKIAA